MASRLTSKGTNAFDRPSDQWLSEALAQPVRIQRVEPILQGHIANVSRLYIGHPLGLGPSELPETLILKGPADPDRYPLGQAFDSFEREAYFYTEIAPKLPLDIPRCWAVDRKSNQGPVLLLEDLGDHRPIDDTRSIQGALKPMADLHTIPTQGLGVKNSLYSNINNLRSICEPNTTSFSLARQIRSGPFKTALIEALERDAPTPTDGHQCLIHCDFRWDNLLPARGGILIDWGDYCIGPPAYDLAYFFATTLASMPLEQQPEKLEQWMLTAVCAYQEHRLHALKPQHEEQPSSTDSMIQSMTHWLPLAAWTPLTLLAEAPLSTAGQHYWTQVFAHSQKLFEVLTHLRS